MKSHPGSIEIQRIFLRHLEFASSEVYEGGDPPDLKVDFRYTKSFPDPGRLEATVTVIIEAGPPPHAFTLKAVMTGLFRKAGEGRPTLEAFAEFNAPAYLYPFLREAVASTLSKSSYPPLLLPPINLVEILGKRQVMIRCPETGKPLSTGLSMDAGSFESSTLENDSVECPHCGKTHTWSKEDAFLEGSLESRGES